MFPLVDLLFGEIFASMCAHVIIMNVASRLRPEREWMMDVHGQAERDKGRGNKLQMQATGLETDRLTRVGLCLTYLLGILQSMLATASCSPTNRLRLCSCVKAQDSDGTFTTCRPDLAPGSILPVEQHKVCG